MAISKRLFAEAVLNRLNGGKIDRDSKFTLNQVMLAIGAARNAIIEKDINENYAHPEIQSFDVPYDVLSEYVVTTQYNETKKIYYIELPVKTISLYKGLGIYHVSVVGDEANALVPLKSGFLSLHNGLNGSDLGGRCGYIPRGNTLELKGISQQSDLMIRVIADSYSLGDRDDFMMPSNWQLPVMQMAFQDLAPQAQLPQDFLLDNTTQGKI